MLAAARGLKYTENTDKNKQFGYIEVDVTVFTQILGWRLIFTLLVTDVHNGWDVAGLVRNIGTDIPAQSYIFLIYYLIFSTHIYCII